MHQRFAQIPQRGNSLTIAENCDATVVATPPKVGWPVPGAVHPLQEQEIVRLGIGIDQNRCTMRRTKLVGPIVVRSPERAGYERGV